MLGVLVAVNVNREITMYEETQLERLEQSIERIQSRLKRKKKKSAVNDPTVLAKRRVSCARNTVAFIERHDPTSCDTEIENLKRQQEELRSQYEVLNTRIAYWSKLRDNQASLLSEANADLERATEYLKSLQGAPAREADLEKLGTLQKFLQDAGVTADNVSDLKVLLDK